MPWYDWLFTTKADIGYFHGTTCITGWCLVVCYGVLGLGSLPCIRKRNYFEVCSCTFCSDNPIVTVTPQCVIKNDCADNIKD